MAQEVTERLASFLEGQPEYVLEFTADFGGDTSDYLTLGPDEEAPDPSAIPPTQVGEAIRLFMTDMPASDLPADLDLSEVDWSAIGERMDQIVATSFGLC